MATNGPVELAANEGAARDTTEDWLLAAAARPRSFGELEARIEYAVTLARSSEAAVAEIGAAALDAAEQSRRAAQLAEQAPAAAAHTNGAAPIESATVVNEGPVTPDQLSLERFIARSDQVMARLLVLQQV